MINSKLSIPPLLYSDSASPRLE